MRKPSCESRIPAQMNHNYFNIFCACTPPLFFPGCLFPLRKFQFQLIPESLNLFPVFCIRKLILDYSRHSRESVWKPHSYCILTEYCFSPVKYPGIAPAPWNAGCFTQLLNREPVFTGLDCPVNYLKYTGGFIHKQCAYFLAVLIEEIFLETRSPAWDTGLRSGAAWQFPP